MKFLLRFSGIYEHFCPTFDTFLRNYSIKYANMENISKFNFKFQMLNSKINKRIFQFFQFFQFLSIFPIFSIFVIYFAIHFWSILGWFLAEISFHFSLLKNVAPPPPRLLSPPPLSPPASQYYHDDLVVGRSTWSVIEKPMNCPSVAWRNSPSRPE